MTGLLLAIFLGWAGGYRFYKKQVGLGILYLLTGGIFFVGWVVDIFLAIREMIGVNSAPSIIQSTVQVKGAFAECRKDPSRKRAEIIEGLNVGDALTFETGLYEGKPFYMVVDPKTGMDIGALPSETNQSIRKQFTDPKLSASLTKKDTEHPEIFLTVKR